jgi:hypothetical protein
MSRALHSQNLPLLGLTALLALALGAESAAQRGRGPGPGQGPMMMHDQAHQADMRLFHELLDNRHLITRQVTKLNDGIDTLTESDDPAVARKLQVHVAAMSARVTEARPIHQRDPLFREIFRNTDKIVMRHELTPNGVRVIETSADPYVALLIQAHAEVVNGFIANGHAEMMKNHPVPERPVP